MNRSLTLFFKDIGAFGLILILSFSFLWIGCIIGYFFGLKVGVISVFLLLIAMNLATDALWGPLVIEV